MVKKLTTNAYCSVLNAQIINCGVIYSYSYLMLNYLRHIRRVPILLYIIKK